MMRNVGCGMRMEVGLLMHRRMRMEVGLRMHRRMRNARNNACAATTCRSALARECVGSLHAAVSGRMLSRASALLQLAVVSNQSLGDAGSSNHTPAATAAMPAAQDNACAATICRSALARECDGSLHAAVFGRMLSRASALLELAIVSNQSLGDAGLSRLTPPATPAVLPAR